VTPTELYQNLPAVVLKYSSLRENLHNRLFPMRIYQLRFTFNLHFCVIRVTSADNKLPVWWSKFILKTRIESGKVKTPLATKKPL
jgi:hypothetical protein